MPVEIAGSVSLDLHYVQRPIDLDATGGREFREWQLLVSRRMVLRFKNCLVRRVWRVRGGECSGNGVFLRGEMDGD